VGTAFSNNILRAGKHYASFCIGGHRLGKMYVGIMRPGRLANQNASGIPLRQEFYQNFEASSDNNNNVQCCIYSTYDEECYSSSWNDSQQPVKETWVGMKGSSSREIGLLLDLDEGTLSVYKNGHKQGVMKSGLSGPYCWGS